MTDAQVLPPSAAGRFYPADAETLRADIHRYVGDAQMHAWGKTIRTIVVPHAGHMYSGLVAGAAFASVRNQNPETIVFLAVSHHGTEGACVFSLGGMRTPLGVVKTDTRLRDSLLESGAPFHGDVSPFQGEHSVEVNLPFVQVLFPQAQIVPVLMNRYDPEVCSLIGQKLARVIHSHPRNVLLAVSTDLSHYPAYADATALDRETLSQIASMDREHIVNAWNEWKPSPETNTLCRLCGRAAVLSGIEASHALGASRGRVLMYQNSGDESGDTSRVVGYGAIAMYEPEEEPAEGDALSIEAQNLLLQTARQAIQANLSHTSPPALPALDSIQKPMGCFVTVRNRGELRGCLGRFDPDGQSLVSWVSRMAVEAASHDPRFDAITAEEMDHLSIHISVVSKPCPTDAPEQIVIGTHGLQVRGCKNGVQKAGTLLPQVAEERGWSPVEFWEATCMKAGLDRDAWRDADTELLTFTARHFGDTTIK